ncbi:hypothetical protein FD02_GL000862 [Lacticaseibacillus nasuensis JCM 17158]|uniref:Reverse transcriptase domain-containing protein n=2 Tax=Lacticaseibacillus TaxID=2759736 RepID=A0A0R1JSC5_9LACO|nr:hypothetical protein FD02_GL000862 [Lacticaseibacillus nasuensis JCM 17158]
MTASEARSFFSKPQSYVPMLLPEYFNFEPVLDYAKSELTKHQLSSMIDKDCLLTDEKVNHTVLLNKDARYDWRPVQIIHPFLYINLVNLLTEEQNWSEIISRFQVFQTDKHIECISLPVESVGENNDTAETILHWWEEMEQNSIVKSLMYKYCIRTDITNCYGSIYTHSIDWAIRGKAKAKDGRRNNKALGFRIDRAIEQIQCGQTNGIPQGGVLFNFIAEIVLGYSDMLLASRINKIGNLEDWHIIRYRDDYRVFSNSKETAEQVVKTLSDVLVDLNMHFNSKKTGITSEIIESAIKPDKIYWNSKIPVIMPIIFDGKRKNVQYQLTLQKHLLEILWLSKKYPNSGSITKALTAFARRLDGMDSINDQVLPLISIIADIVSHNPSAISSGIGVLSKLISKTQNDPVAVSQITDLIINKLQNTPNLNYLDVWLQRLTILSDKTKNFSEKLCVTVTNPDTSIWSSAFFSDKRICLPPIVDMDEVKSIKAEIATNVFDVFSDYD